MAAGQAAFFLPQDGNRMTEGTQQTAPAQTPAQAPARPGGQFALRHQAVLLATMLVCTFFSLFLFAIRVVKTGSTTHGSLVWNLFLAWIPAGLALLAYNLYRKWSCLGAAVVLPIIPVWLLFFPNAPYLLTDIVHLADRPEMPYWFDQILYLAFAFTGCYLGMISLLLMQALVRRSLGVWISWLFALFALFLSGFGIYLGRFTRFNSWEVLTAPKPIVKEILDWFLHPKSNIETFAFAIVFSIFFASIYLVIVAFVNLGWREKG
jgi:uncharacterized membrane protein